MDANTIMREVERLAARVATGPLASRARRLIGQRLKPEVRRAVARDPDHTSTEIHFQCYLDSNRQVRWGHSRADTSLSRLLRQLGSVPEESLVVTGSIGPPRGRRSRTELYIEVHARRVSPGRNARASASTGPPGRRRRPTSRAEPASGSGEGLREFIREIRRARPRSTGCALTPRD